jgi:hypothetical protein
MSFYFLKKPIWNDRNKGKENKMKELIRSLVILSCRVRASAQL